ncbi:vomeronasal type-2 receptor 26-like [Ascaphus truei]|uniref:vomeronasal type-2 receptor 26-like n=1 Tax=Ascaphus truei TaxID=8439 RepID=UPI003F591282
MAQEWDHYLQAAASDHEVSRSSSPGDESQASLDDYDGKRSVVMHRTEFHSSGAAKEMPTPKDEWEWSPVIMMSARATVYPKRRSTKALAVPREMALGMHAPGWENHVTARSQQSSEDTSLHVPAKGSSGDVPDGTSSYAEEINTLPVQPDVVIAKATAATEEDTTIPALVSKAPLDHLLQQHHDRAKGPGHKDPMDPEIHKLLAVTGCGRQAKTDSSKDIEEPAAFTKLTQDNQPIPKNYRHLLAFIFAIDEINRNPDILPNVTLGYHAYDSCADVNKAIESVIQILSGPGKTAPNYSCMQHGKLAGFIGDLSSLTSLPIAQTLRIYGYSQISYGATDPLLGNKLFYPSFFQTHQNDQIQYKAISKLLRHFGWTWVGIIASDDEGGETQSQELEKEATNHGICIEFILKIARLQSTNRRELNARNTAILQSSNSQVVVLCGAVSLSCIYSIGKECAAITEKTLIVPATWTFHKDNHNISITPFNGSLSFTHPRKNIPAMKDFLENVNPASRPHDQLLEHMWTMYLKCLSSNPDRNMIIERLYNVHLSNCTEKKRLTDIGNRVYNTHRFGTTYHVYVAVYAMAHALHKMHLSISRNPAKKHQQNYEYKQQLQNFIRGVRFKDPTGEDVYFNEKGEMATLYHIINRFVLANGTFLVRHVGSFNTSAPEGEQLIINQSDIMWKHNLSQIPRSQCSENCFPGYRKVSRRGQPACCYDCIRCSMGEISNQSDSESCQKCPDDRWPNEKKNKCVLKSTEFLSYKRDPIAPIFSFISVLCSIITAIILRIFILFRDTPIVKANNHNLSLILLVSIMLSFLCVFLFLGRPVDITCRLRQTSFGIIFSIAVSSVLAKTIMVCIAFKATKPGNTWRKWMGVKISNCVVFMCSFIQVLISVSWLAISPPFQELNTHSYPGKIIIQCNEGSVVAFYTVLGYLGFLAAASFIVAFLARKLPDSFNEAKYITFSMLVFCSVWVSVIPAYLSVMGKNMVIVEIFAILSSSAGILSCIFFPKCYIMLLRPDLNTKSYLFRKANI